MSASNNDPSVAHAPSAGRPFVGSPPRGGPPTGNAVGVGTIRDIHIPPPLASSGRADVSAASSETKGPEKRTRGDAGAADEAAGRPRNSAAVADNARAAKKARVEESLLQWKKALDSAFRIPFFQPSTL